MTDDTEFGPWQDHDGKGCPCVGQMVEAEFESGDAEIFIAACQGGRSWDQSWADEFDQVVAFRIRKPRALLDLIQMIADLPAVKQPSPGVIA